MRNYFSNVIRLSTAYQALLREAFIVFSKAFCFHVKVILMFISFFYSA